MSELLSVPEAATVAGVSERTIRRWASSGHVRTVVTGQGRRVVATSLPEAPATNGHRPNVGRPPSGTETVMAGQADKLAESTAVAAMWQERARVLNERLAIAAPRPENGTVEAPTATEAPELSVG